MEGGREGGRDKEGKESPLFPVHTTNWIQLIRGKNISDAIVSLNHDEFE